MIPIYLLATGICSGILALFLHQLLAEQGFIPTVYAGFTFVFGVAMALAAVQLAYRSILRFIWPTSSPASLVTESISMAACLVFVPFLAHVDIAWPHSALDRVEPLVYLAAFMAIHVVVKGISFFTLLRSWPGTRYGVLGWTGLTAFCVLLSLVALSGWAQAVDAAKPMAPTESELYRAGNLRLAGRYMREGAILQTDLTVRKEDSLLLLWSAPPAERNVPSPKQAYVTVRFSGEESNRVEQIVDIAPDTWNTMLIGAADIPEGATTCSVTWHAEDVPSWRTIPGLEPVTKSNLALLMSEPLARASQAESETPSVLLITVDGLSAEHMQAFGYERETTPNLSAFGRRALRYPLAYTVAPDPEAAVASIFTGRDPLRHQHFETEKELFEPGMTTIAEALAQRGYFTLALTEGARDGRFAYESGFDAAIDQFDDGFTEHAVNESNAITGGSAATIWKAEDWIRHYAGVKFFLWLRLSDLQDPRLRPGYPSDFLPERGEASERDRYDTALKYLDHQLGGLLRGVTETGLSDQVCVIVMGNYGRIAGSELLTELPLHVPLMIYGSGVGRGERELFVQQDDVGVTLAAILDIDLGEGITGRNLLSNPPSSAPVSILPNPLRLSTCGQRFRLTWNTEDDNENTSLQMYALGSGQPVSNPARTNPYTVRRLMAPMEKYLDNPLERGLVPVNLPQE